MFWILQYKLLAEFPSINLATWNYHESGHGKGAPDGIGAVVKRTADGEIAQGRDIIDIDSMMFAFKKKIIAVDLSVIQGTLIREMSKSISTNIKPFPGTLKIPQIMWKKGEIALIMNRLICLSCPHDYKTYKVGSNITLPRNVRTSNLTN